MGGGGFADALKLELVEAAARVVAGDAREAAVDDGGDAVDGERGFGDVGGEDDFAARRWLQGEGLLVGGEGAVEGENEDIVLAREGFEAVHGATDLLRAGE